MKIQREVAVTGHAPGRRLVRRLGLLCLSVLGSGFSIAAPAAPVQFNRDIRPILSENCLACHGPDPGARKAGLRLDTKEGFFEATPKRGATVVAGDPERSELWRRINAPDEDDLMPPPKSNKVLTGAQKELVRQWIQDGAEWQGHWAFVRPQRPSLPTVKQTAWVRNPVDAFVLSRLESRGLQPAPEADRRALLRRLCLDLTGLPPRPDWVESFVRDRHRDSYERQVRRLMALPQYGEHRARYWLDAVRYADTHGLHFDNYREIWPYRDWVIQAFNRNQRFDQFTIEQLAGDLLEHPTDDQVVATGLQRCNMSTNEGGTIEDENLANYANDRVTTTGWVFLGLTMNCAACHDHKFDPLTTKDFYSLAAFYRNTREGGLDHNWREGDQHVVVPQTETDRQRWRALPAALDAAAKAREQQAAEADKAFTNWVLSARAAPVRPPLQLGGEHLWLPLNEGRGTNVSGEFRGRRQVFGGPAALDWRGGPQGPAPVLTTNSNFVLGNEANFDGRSPFSVAAWVWVPEDFKGGGAILARMDGTGDEAHGWEFYIRDGTFGIQLVRNLRATAMRARGPDKSLKPGRWQHLAATYDGFLRGAGVRLMVDGVDVEASHDPDRLDGTVTSGGPLRLGRRECGEALEGVAVQDVRMYLRRLEGAEVAALAAAPRVSEMLAQVDFASTNNPPREVLRQYYRATQHRGWKQAAAVWRRLEDERLAIRSRSPVTLVQREKTNSEPSAHVLFRGQYDQPREKLAANTPSALPPLPDSAPRNRLGLARWLVSPENPLTARVTVNRLWQEVFGTGLVKTSEDFGTMGTPPSHQDLLDWLAVEFVESGWNVQHILTLLVTSATYRQSTTVTPEKLEKDPDNRWLSRGPRFRMDAEMVRDYALAASGLLSTRVGGPSAKPYQPPGVWEAVAMPESNTRHFERDQGENLYRRSLYTFWKRAAPPASLELFNAPSRETCTVRRERTDTPLQALVTLNDPQFVEAARHLAETAWNAGRDRRDEVLNELALRLLCRPLTGEERAVVVRTLDALLAYYEANPAQAAALLEVGDSPATPKVGAPQLAAWTLVANQLLNLDEVLNK